MQRSGTTASSILLKPLTRQRLREASSALRDLIPRDCVSLNHTMHFRFPLTFENYQSTYAILEPAAEWGPRALVRSKPLQFFRNA